MAKHDQQPEPTQEPTQEALPDVDTFSAPIDPEGEGKITLVTNFPYGEYVAKDRKTSVKHTGTNMSRDEANKLLEEAPGVVRELKKKES